MDLEIYADQEYTCVFYREYFEKMNLSIFSFPPLSPNMDKSLKKR